MKPFPREEWGEKRAALPVEPGGRVAVRTPVDRQNSTRERNEIEYRTW